MLNARERRAWMHKLVTCFGDLADVGGNGLRSSNLVQSMHLDVDVEQLAVVKLHLADDAEALSFKEEGELEVAIPVLHGKARELVLHPTDSQRLLLELHEPTGNLDEVLGLVADDGQPDRIEDVGSERPASSVVRRSVLPDLVHHPPRRLDGGVDYPYPAHLIPERAHELEVVRLAPQLQVVALRRGNLMGKQDVSDAGPEVAVEDGSASMELGNEGQLFQALALLALS
eukprot:764417-Hanusia_phi.AAC.1